MTGVWRIAWASVVAVLCFSAAASAAPPRIQAIDPPTAQRGVETLLRLSGKGLIGGAELVVPFAAEVHGSSAGGEGAAFTIKPAAGTPPGMYPLRVRTAGGISNLRLILVTDVPVVQAKEPNGRYFNGRLDLDQAQRITWPCVIAGARLVQDIDTFRFTARAGDRLVFVTETWRMGLTPDPFLQLRDSRGRLLVLAHDTPGLQRDERIDHTFDHDGEYVLEVQSTGGAGWNNHYLLRIGPFDYARAVFPLGGRRGDMVPFEVLGRDGKTSTVAARVPADPWSDRWHLPLTDHPGSLPWPVSSGDLPEVIEDAGRTEAQPLAWPATVNGRIGAPDEEDLYRIAVKPGQHVRVQVEAYYLGSCLDGFLMVFDPKGKKLLAKNDDQVYRGNPDPALTFEVPTGVEEVVISLRDALGRGGIDHSYRLTIEQGGPDFLLWLGRKQAPTNKEDDGWHRMDASDTLNLVPGQEVALPLAVRRSAKADDPHYNGPGQGYTGPITLRALNVPDGVTVKPVVLAAGQTECTLTVVAKESAPRQPFELVIVGEGRRSDGTVFRHLAERRLYLSDPQLPNMSWNWRVTKVIAVVAQP